MGSFGRCRGESHLAACAPFMRKAHIDTGGGVAVLRTWCNVQSALAVARHPEPKTFDGIVASFRA
jgi:hypothetical protein